MKGVYVKALGVVLLAVVAQCSSKAAAPVKCDSVRKCPAGSSGAPQLCCVKKVTAAALKANRAAVPEADRLGECRDACKKLLEEEYPKPPSESFLPAIGGLSISREKPALDPMPITPRVPNPATTTAAENKAPLTRLSTAVTQGRALKLEPLANAPMPGDAKANAPQPPASSAVPLQPTPSITAPGLKVNPRLKPIASPTEATFAGVHFWTRAAAGGNYDKYAALVNIDYTRLSDLDDRQLDKILGLYHETSSMEAIWKSGHLIAAAQLPLIIPKFELSAGSAKDRRQGGGFSVYTRVLTSNFQLGTGSKGLGLDWMIVLTPDLALRSDSWASSSDLNGGLPYDFCKPDEGSDRAKGPSKTCFAAFKKVGYAPTTGAVGPGLCNAYGGQNSVSYARTIKGIVSDTPPAHQELGFLKSVSLADWLLKLVYKKDDKETVESLVSKLMEWNAPLVERLRARGVAIENLIVRAQAGQKVVIPARERTRSIPLTARGQNLQLPSKLAAAAAGPVAEQETNDPAEDVAHIRDMEDAAVAEGMGHPESAAAVPTTTTTTTTAAPEGAAKKPLRNKP